MTVSVTIQFANQADAAAFLAGGKAPAGSTSTVSTAAAAPKPAKPAKPKHTVDELKAVAGELIAAYGVTGKDEGKASARTTFQPLGYNQIGEVKEEHIDKVFDDLKALLAAKQAEQSDDGL